MRQEERKMIKKGFRKKVLAGLLAAFTVFGAAVW